VSLPSPTYTVRQTTDRLTLVIMREDASYYFVNAFPFRSWTTAAHASLLTKLCLLGHDDDAASSRSGSYRKDHGFTTVCGSGVPLALCR
jgi:hypothetical protein